MRELEIIKRLVGEITAEEFDTMSRLNDAFIHSPLTIFVPSMGICEYSLSPRHRHPGYMFIISITDGGGFIVEGEKVQSEVRYNTPLLALSPEIEHQEELGTGEQHYYALFIEKEFFYKTLHSRGVKERPLKGELFETSRKLISYCRLFISEFSSSSSGRDEILTALTTLITQELIDTVYEDGGVEADLNISAIDDTLIYIKSHISEKLTVDLLANRINRSTSTFNREFKSETGKTPIDYILHKRLEYAKQLLSSGDISITEVADICGFSSLSYFSTQFKKFYNLSPREYRITTIC